MALSVAQVNSLVSDLVPLDEWGLDPETLDRRMKDRLRSRYRTQRELRGRKPDEVLAALTKWVTALDANDPNRGFDAQSGEYVDMVKAGIIDPTKVVRLALQNAASVAGLLVTTEAMVAEKPEKKAAPAMPHDHGMGGMDDF